MPNTWKALMVVLIVCLIASMAIAIVRLATTPTEILGDGFRGLPVRTDQRR
jgi:Na+-transporting NADH:ubiquinone oxidoreductase subunit NqrC